MLCLFKKQKTKIEELVLGEFVIYSGKNNWCVMVIIIFGTKCK